MLYRLLSFFTALTITTLHSAPNIIVILTDDLGYGDLYAFHQHKRDKNGNRKIDRKEAPFINTPYLDRMVAEGTMMSRHYSSAPVCAPARASLLQGLDQGHSNIRNNSFDKPLADNHTLGTMLKQAGYYTACVGKWGVGGKKSPYTAHPNQRGFDYFYGSMKHLQGHNHYPQNSGAVWENKTPIKSGLEHAYSTDLWTAKVKDIIKKRTSKAPDQPFFIYLAYDAPHAVLQVPTMKYPRGLGLRGGLKWPLNTNSGTNNTYIHPDYKKLNPAAKHHATMVRRLDTCMGDILQTLRDLKIDDNTLVIFTSDNGTHNEAGHRGRLAHDPRNFDSFGELEGIKRDLWEGGIRVPTIAWWPSKIGDNNAKTPGGNSKRPSAFWDWMPTLAEAAGSVPPAWSNGVSLLPELTGKGQQQDKGYLYFEYKVAGKTPKYQDFPNHGGTKRGQMQAIFLDDTDGKRYKGVRTGFSKHSKDFEIYDVDADPNESKNLAFERPNLQREMKKKVLQVRIDNGYKLPYSAKVKVPAVTPTSLVNGLNYKAYEGTWKWVPETAYLTPNSSGTCSHLDLSKRTKSENLALEFTGYISIPKDGKYTFVMSADTSVKSSDSGAMLWIHDANIIEDDFNHNGNAKKGSITLKAGLHPIRVLYKHAKGKHDLELKYAGPGMPMQRIPEKAFFRSSVSSKKNLSLNNTDSTVR